LSDGYFVIGVDNFSTGNKYNLDEFLASPSFRFMYHDITHPFEQEADAIVNLACPASPQHYQKDPIQTSKTCFLGTLNLLELAQKQGAFLVQASTSEVYGSALQHPQTEDYWGNVNPIGIRACYDEGKRIAETLCFDAYRMHGTDTRVLRIFNTYGPFMDINDGRVISTLICQALRGRPLTVFGSGSQSRSFCFVDDLVDAFCKLLDPSIGHVGPFNVGNPHEVTMIELVHIIMRLTKSSSQIVHLDLPEDDPPRRRPDISRITQNFGWRPTTPLEKGIAATVVYYQSLLKEHASLQGNNSYEEVGRSV
jgi:UDP-glucuronate decarboxylase